jgi:antitoxin component of MazEF toxin-antitoxin module
MKNKEILKKFSKQVRKRRSLKDLLAKIPAKCQFREEKWGKFKGKEVW